MGGRLHVLHVFHHIFHYACGYRTRSESVLRHQHEQGIEISVVTAGDREGGHQLPDPDIARVRRTALAPALRGPRELHLMWRLYAEVSRAIRDELPDVVHAHSPVLVALPAWRAARRHGCPFVYEVRDLWENASVDLGKFAERSWQYRAARAADTFVLRRADAVTVICDSMRDEIVNRLGTADGVFVVPNGVTPGLRTEPPQPARARWRLPHGPVLGYIGMLQPYEGLDLLIAALPAIVRDLPGAHLLVVGDGRHESELRALARARGVADHVTFTGRLPHDDVSHAYAACDALVYPRRLTNTTRLTTPLKPLEAMALGKAVIAADLPPMREVVPPGTGVLFRAGDVTALAGACVRVLSDPALREQMGRAAREWVGRERQWRSTAKEYLRVYQHATRGAFDSRLPVSLPAGPA